MLVETSASQYYDYDYYYCFWYGDCEGYGFCYDDCYYGYDIDACYDCFYDDYYTYEAWEDCYYYENHYEDCEYFEWCAYDCYYGDFDECLICGEAMGDYYSDYYQGDDDYSDMVWNMAYAVADDLIAANEEGEIETDEDLAAVMGDSIWDHASDNYGEYAYYYEQELDDLADYVAECVMEYAEYYGYDVEDEDFREELAGGVFQCTMNALEEWYDEEE